MGCLILEDSVKIIPALDKSIINVECTKQRNCDYLKIVFEKGSKNQDNSNLEFCPYINGYQLCGVNFNSNKNGKATKD